ncbi:MAG: glycosyltransferase [Nanoarchaeota archaeon]
MKKQKNLLVTLADKNYVKQAKQLFSSVYWNAGWKGDYMLLAHEIPEKELKWFRKKGILIKKCRPLVNKELKQGKWKKLVFSKAYLFTRYFKKWKLVLFLDADIIVRFSLNSLLKKGFWAAKGHNTREKLLIGKFHARINNCNYEKYKKLRKQLHLNSPAFNTGVMLFDTQLIKSDFAKFKSMIKEYGEISASGEELIFNLFIGNKWKKLKKYYNLCPDYSLNNYKIKKEEIKAIILHFSLEKPWNKSSPFYEEWKNNLKKAEKINLRAIPKAKSPDNKSLNLFLRKLKNNALPVRIRESYSNFKISADSKIGLAGILLKRYSPRTYIKLKYWLIKNHLINEK